MVHVHEIVREAWAISSMDARTDPFLQALRRTRRHFYREPASGLERIIHARQQRQRFRDVFEHVDQRDRAITTF